jgi:DNA-binding CsgD family transcriptional regulator
VHLNARQIERLAEAYEAGATVYELAAEFHIDRGTVSQRLKSRGVIMRSQHRLTGPSLDKAIRLYSGGWSCKSIGDHLGYNQRTIWTALRNAGVVLRPRRGWTYSK